MSVKNHHPLLVPCSIIFQNKSKVKLAKAMIEAIRLFKYFIDTPKMK